MASTVKDFWRMIWEHQSKCIVMLCEVEEEGEVAVTIQRSKHGLYSYCFSIAVMLTVKLTSSQGTSPSPELLIPYLAEGGI